MVVDTLLLIALTAPLLLLAYDFEELARPALVRGVVDLIVSWLAPVVATLLFWRYRSATPGKMLIGAVIVDANTLGAPTMRQLVIRYFAYIVSIVPVGLGFLWIAWDPRKQSFHDKLANTLVVYKVSPAESGATRV